MVSSIPQGLEAAIKISALSLRLNIDQVNCESEGVIFKIDAYIYMCVCVCVFVLH